MRGSPAVTLEQRGIGVCTQMCTYNMSCAELRTDEQWLEKVANAEATNDDTEWYYCSRNVRLVDALQSAVRLLTIMYVDARVVIIAEYTGMGRDQRVVLSASLCRS